MVQRVYLLAFIRLHEVIQQTFIDSCSFKFHILVTLVANGGSLVQKDMQRLSKWMCLQRCRNEFLFSNEPGIPASEPGFLSQHPSPPPASGCDFGYLEKGTPTPASTTSQSQYSNSAHIGSGCPWVWPRFVGWWPVSWAGSQLSGVWNWLFFNLCDLSWSVSPPCLSFPASLGRGCLVSLRHLPVYDSLSCG